MESGLKLIDEGGEQPFLLELFIKADILDHHHLLPVGSGYPSIDSDAGVNEVKSLKGFIKLTADNFVYDAPRGLRCIHAVFVWG